MGFNRFEMYSGVRSFNALKVKTALLLLWRFAIVDHPSSLNISEDGVSKSASRIMRAARFCNFDNLSMFSLDVDPQVLEP